ncbi:hypothetical protein ACERII_06940 [Evansella sp. AB-rgal1]|uniref:hypothetical protein n=1 Tax=Evansella sp. AB-rgal1 TaxID=3242696 RepID=UPI00359EA5C8
MLKILFIMLLLIGGYYLGHKEMNQDKKVKMLYVTTSMIALICSFSLLFDHVISGYTTFLYYFFGRFTKRIISQ